MYSELSESKKEMDSLRNDLQYWKNETLTILRKYLIIKESESNLYMLLVVSPFLICMRTVYT